jgi:hypothetical protein
MYWTNLVNNIEKQAAANPGLQFSANDMVAIGTLANQVFGGYQKEAAPAWMQAMGNRVRGWGGKVADKAMKAWGGLSPDAQQDLMYAGGGAGLGALLGGLGGAIRDDGSVLGGMALGGLGGGLAGLGGSMIRDIPGAAANYGGYGNLLSAMRNNPQAAALAGAAGLGGLAGLGGVGYGMFGA